MAFGPRRRGRSPAGRVTNKVHFALVLAALATLASCATPAAAVETASAAGSAVATVMAWLLFGLFTMALAFR